MGIPPSFGCEDHPVCHIKARGDGKSIGREAPLRYSIGANGQGCEVPTYGAVARSYNS